MKNVWPTKAVAYIWRGMDIFLTKLTARQFNSFYLIPMKGKIRMQEMWLGLARASARRWPWHHFRICIDGPVPYLHFVTIGIGAIDVLGRMLSTPLRTYAHNSTRSFPGIVVKSILQFLHNNSLFH